MMKRGALILVAIAILAGLGLLNGNAVQPPDSIWTVTPEEYFDSPAISVLVFHDYYPEGKQGGLEIIQHGERVAADGDVRLEVTPGQWADLPMIGRRQVDRSSLEIKVPASFAKPELRYTVRVKPEGEAVRVSVDLDQPLPAGLIGKASFNIELFPSAYFGKTYHLGTKSAVFPRQGNGPMISGEFGLLQPVAIAAGPKLIIAPEDPLRMMTIESLTGDLELYDGRDTSDNGWFVVRSALKPGRAKGAAEWIIAPHRVPAWMREPVIAVSQVGYHPDQVKRAVIELDRRSGLPGKASLFQVNWDGGLREVLTALAIPWTGKFLRYDYAFFDFSQVREPGMYIVKYGSVETPPFAIGRDVYRGVVWQPTLETYLPVQMCHVEVRDVLRIWHGACHLDDAVQAPPSTVHFDSYQQGPVLKDRFAAFEHIPHLDRGGWHDAGDYDLAAGSQADVTLVLALIRETFGLATDQTTVNQAGRLVVLHDPDGIPDVVQQVEHGAESLLSGYRAAGHSFCGIIEGSIVQYSLLGDTASMTDNRIFDPALKPDETAEGRSDLRDDRWAFTDPDTSLEYKVASALAAAGRVLKGTNEKLARECLETALMVWGREQSRTPVVGHAAYVPGRPEVQEVLAAVELLIATKQARFGDRLAALLPVIEKNFDEVGWTVSRVLPLIKDQPFHDAVGRAAARYAEETERELASNPFGVLWRPEIWGIGWDIQDFAIGQYFLIKAFPVLFRPETIFRVLNYVLGCHPGSNVSFVSGVGARSLTIGYGFNRADWSYIPGMNVSGTALIRPDFPELKDDFPFLWQQAENVIGGAASYIFTVLAADELLNGKSGSPGREKPGRTEIAKWQNGSNAAVSLTFDDGSINQFRVAVPIMRGLGLPATFHIITSEVAGSRYQGAFIGRPTRAVVLETAAVPTDKENFFERASAIGRLGLSGTLEYHTRAGELYEDGRPEEAYRLIDEAYAKVRHGDFKPEASQPGSREGREMPTWDELAALAAQGHEISSHTVTHPRLAVLDDANLVYELEKSREEILDHLGAKHTFTVECPYGTEDERVVGFALARYPASRNRMPEPFLEELDRDSDKNPADSAKEYVQWQRGVLTKTPMPLMKEWVDTVAAHDNMWLVLVFHGVDGIGWEPKTGAELKDYFGYIKSKANQVWTATFQDAAKYMRERMHGRVASSRRGEAIEIVLGHDLNNPRYDLPLTLKTYLPEDWSTVEVRQGRRSELLPAVRDERGSYVIYQAAPNAEPVILSQAALFIGNKGL